MDHGYDAEVIDCSHYDPGLEGVIEKLKEDEKSIIGITAYTRERFAAYDLIRKIRNDIPDSLIVVGGRHFTYLADEALKNLPEIDIVVRGEGEITFKEICDFVYYSKSLNDIKGISFREECKVVHNPERPLERNLDMFRSFDRNHLPDPEKHSLTSILYKVGGKNKKMEVFKIMASVGVLTVASFAALLLRK